MKKRKWQYLTIMFLAAGIITLTLSFITPVSTPSPAQYQITATPIEIDIPRNYIPLRITPTVDPEHLDQYSCETTENHWIISVSTVWILQEFVNEGEPLEAFSVIVTEYLSPTHPLVIGVVDSKMPIDELSNLDNWECYGVLQPNTLPSDWPDFYWITADFSNNPIPIPAGQMYYIAAASGVINIAQGYFGLAYNGDCYPDYTSWDYYFPEEQYYDTLSDICFATYTTTGGGGEPPQVTITSTYQVMTQFSASLFLLGAVISGTKYFMVV